MTNTSLTQSYLKKTADRIDILDVLLKEVGQLVLRLLRVPVLPEKRSAVGSGRARDDGRRESLAPKRPGKDKKECDEYDKERRMNAADPAPSHRRGC